MLPFFLGRRNKLTFGKYVSVNSTRSNRIENVKNLDTLPRWIFTSFLDIRSHLSCSTQSKTNRFDVNRLSLSFLPPFFFSSRLKSNHFRNFISINISLYSGFFLISKKKKKKNNNKMNEILRGKEKLISLRISLVNQFIIFFRMHVDSLELIMETLLKLQNYLSFVKLTTLFVNNPILMTWMSKLMKFPLLFIVQYNTPGKYSSNWETKWWQIWPTLPSPPPTFRNEKLLRKVIPPSSDFPFSY